MQLKTKIKSGPLLCWDIYATYLIEQSNFSNKLVEKQALNVFKKKFNWSVDIDETLDSHNYEALVLTDVQQHIQWVNKGFSKMTGFPANYTKHKTPNFLQGEKTCKETLSKIRMLIKKGKGFTEQIVNYKKDGTPYKCHIKMYPLRNNNKTITHFLALEKTII